MTGRRMDDQLMTNTAFDYAATARRRPWHQLPAEVQQYIGGVLGAPVTAVALAGAGFTHGFAAVVHGHGRQLFAKAAPADDAQIFPAYVREAEVLAALPPGIPVPNLLAADTVQTPEDRWQVLCFEAIAGYLPGVPWTERDLAATHDSLLTVQQALLEVPRHVAGEPMADAFGGDTGFNNLFDELAASDSRPSFIPRLANKQLRELQQLCDHSVKALAGDAVLHNDLRADNLIIRESDGRAFLCDWNFLSTGPAWADWAALLLYTRPHGIDAEAWLARSELSAQAAAEDIDSWLAILGAYMIFSGSKPDMPSSPMLRPHGRYTAQLIIEWLAERRGWNR